MIDHSCDDKLEEDIRTCALSQTGVLGIDLLHTRMFGSVIYVDIEITADGELPLKETHSIAEHVHDSIEETFPEVKHIMVHVNPIQTEYRSEKHDSDTLF